MAEVLVRFTTSLVGPDGVSYIPQACGGLADDGLWEGWIEFIAAATAVRTPRETEQPNRDALMYWAQGLSVAYIEGAFVRATAERVKPKRSPASREPAASPSFSRPSRASSPRRLKPQRAILDPFATFDQGEGLLRSQLAALSYDNLVTIIEEYQLDVTGASTTSSRSLIDHMVGAVRARSRTVGYVIPS